MTTRRAFIGTLAGGLLAAPLAAEAQQAGKVSRDRRALGVTLRPRTSHLCEAFREGLRELGYIEGQNIVVEVRYAEAKRRSAAARSRPSWSSLKVDVIVTEGPARSLGRQAGDHDDPDRDSGDHRPGGSRARRQPRAAGRERHRRVIGRHRS